MTTTRGRLIVDANLPEGFRYSTDNLDLVPSSQRLTDADWKDHKLLSELLDSNIPESWPPELVVDESSPNGEGWWDWYVISREEKTLIGMVGLKGWPNIGGSVQMGCSFLQGFQRRGFAAEAVAGIAAWALTQPQIDRVTAETPAGNAGAIAVLRKVGFEQVDSDEATLLRFETCKR